MTVQITLFWLTLPLAAPRVSSCPSNLPSTNRPTLLSIKLTASTTKTFSTSDGFARRSSEALTIWRAKLTVRSTRFERPASAEADSDPEQISLFETSLSGRFMALKGRCWTCKLSSLRAKVSSTRLPYRFGFSELTRRLPQAPTPSLSRPSNRLASPYPMSTFPPPDETATRAGLAARRASSTQRLSSTGTLPLLCATRRSSRCPRVKSPSSRSRRHSLPW